jgi:hypothetical protein
MPGAVLPVLTPLMRQLAHYFPDRGITNVRAPALPPLSSGLSSPPPLHEHGTLVSHGALACAVEMCQKQCDCLSV